MLKTAVLAAIAAVCLSLPADARPRHVAHHRYDPACNVSMPCEGIATPDFFAKSAKISAKEARRRARGQELYDAMPFGMPTDRAGRAVPRWAVQSNARPRAWCGWYLRMKLGIRDARLNLARNWATLYGSPSRPQPDAVVVWPHHVGQLVRHVHGDIWIVHSGNDGRAVRTRARSIAGAIAFRA